LRLFNSDDIDNFILIGDFEGQGLLAELTVSLVELEHDLALMDFLRALRFKPRP